MPRFIGDVHGKYRQYKKILKAGPDTIQIGDMGVGFRRRDGSAYENPPFDKMREGNHRFIRGNHDNPAVCKNHSQWIPDGHVEGDMMFVGGAVSVDQAYRQEGYDWWPDEELNHNQLLAIVDKYIEVRPRIMVTHDCPEEIAHYLCALSGRRKLDFPSRSRQAFQSMFQLHQPEVWVFGHWHYSYEMKILGTLWICLNELEVIDI